MKNLVVCQSGGPTSAINASLAGVISASKKNDNINTIYGSNNGVIGLINNDLTVLDLNDNEINLLKTTPSAYLGSARLSLSKSIEDKKYESILNTVKVNDIGYIVFIGGNDSMDTVDKLSKFFKKINYPCNVIGVPKTIDNDLVEIDHTPGYGSAIKYIATTIEEIKLDTSVYQKGRVTIVEIMGRDAGWLTAGSKLASLNNLGPDLIYLPEVPHDIKEILNEINTIYGEKNKVLVAISEGVRDKNGKYLIESYSYQHNNDVFGHMQLGGVSTVLASIVKNELSIPVRGIELNLMQRCAGHILSKTDIDESFKCGEYAVKRVIKTNGKFVSMERISNNPYKIKYTLKNVKAVANKVKEVPQEWIINGNDISDSYLEYALPLIKGEIKKEYENGIPKYLKK